MNLQARLFILMKYIPQLRFLTSIKIHFFAQNICNRYAVDEWFPCDPATRRNPLRGSIIIPENNVFVKLNLFTRDNFFGLIPLSVLLFNHNTIRSGAQVEQITGYTLYKLIRSAYIKKLSEICYIFNKDIPVNSPFEESYNVLPGKQIHKIFLKNLLQFLFHNLSHTLLLSKEE